MRSTQFDETLPFKERPEEYHRRGRPDALCEVIKHMGYGQNSQVGLYGEMFDLVSNPIRDSDDLVSRRNGIKNHVD